MEDKKLSFELIKRKYTLTNNHFADFFVYSNSKAFRTSRVMYLYLVRAVELVYRTYARDGPTAARDKIDVIVWPAETMPARRPQYKQGLINFLDAVKQKDEAGTARDPLRKR